MEPNHANAPWLIIRKRGDTRRRTFVAKLSYATNFLFKKTLHNTIATVTNVVFSGNNTDLSGDPGRVSPITGENVRQMLRDDVRQFLLSLDKFPSDLPAAANQTRISTLGSTNFFAERPPNQPTPRLVLELDVSFFE